MVLLLNGLFALSSTSIAYGYCVEFIYFRLHCIYKSYVNKKCRDNIKDADFVNFFDDQTEIPYGIVQGIF